MEKDCRMKVQTRFFFSKTWSTWVLGHFFTTNPYMKHHVTKTKFTLSAMATGSNKFLRENGVLDALFAGALDRGFCRWWFQTCSFFTTQIEEMIHFDEHICSVGFGPTRSSCFFSGQLRTNFGYNTFQPSRWWMPAKIDQGMGIHRIDWFLLMVQKSDCVKPVEVGRIFSHYWWVCMHARSFWISLHTSRGDHHSSSIHHSGLRSNHWVQIWKSITPWLGSTRNLASIEPSWTQRLKARAFLWVWMGWVWNRPCEILGNPFMKLPLLVTKMLFGFFWKNPCYFPNLPIGNPKRNTQTSGFWSLLKWTRACKDSNLLRTQHQVWVNSKCRLLEQ